METRRADELSLSQLTEAWNLGYAGYFVPIQFTESQLAHWMAAGSFDLSRSLVLMDGESPAGFSFLGVRGRRGWIGGFGIAPDYRGRGLAHQLFAEHVRLFREEGLEGVQLEVLVENWAQRVYAGAGFAVTRRLAILEGRLPESAPAAPVQEGDPGELLRHSTRLHGEYPPVWQREPESLAVSLPAQAEALRMGPAEAPTGYLIYQAGAERVRIIEAAGEAAEARALVEGLAHRHPGAAVAVVNEPEGSPLHRVLTALGLRESRAQWEMRWQPR
ncbi:MAG: GNAT family N-acetyltransferase [Bacillota bacterium]